MDSYHICPYVTCLFHLAWCFQDSSVLYCVSESPSFGAVTIPLHVYTTFCSSFHPLVSTWVASTFGLLWQCWYEHGCMMYVFIYNYVCVRAQSLSHIRLFCPMNCNPPSFSVCGISQARLLQWVLFPSPGDLSNPMHLLHCRQILYHWATWEVHL